MAGAVYMPRLGPVPHQRTRARAASDLTDHQPDTEPTEAVPVLVESTSSTLSLSVVTVTDIPRQAVHQGKGERKRLRKATGSAPIAPARFYSFTDAEENTREQIQKARSHPWISREVPIRGFVYDVHTGRLSEVFPDGETVAG
jgi:carbonic anhydrase